MLRKKSVNIHTYVILSHRGHRWSSILENKIIWKNICFNDMMIHEKDISGSWKLKFYKTYYWMVKYFIISISIMLYSLIYFYDIFKIVFRTSLSLWLLTRTYNCSTERRTVDARSINTVAHVDLLASEWAIRIIYTCH